MQPSRRRALYQVSQAAARLPADVSPFRFPQSTHLLVTTPRHVLSWDSTGLHTIFQSRRNGINAACEAKDGSGFLAVASKSTVIIHDTKRGQENSWGLNADDNEVRRLEYSHDSKSIFFSTVTNGTIQQYSTEHCRLLDPAQTHVTTPQTLAVSSTGHLILSSSSDPPVVFLKNLAHNSPPALVNPSVSSSPVTHAAFHPERANIFLLAFKDGTIAAYDATRITKSSGTSSTYQHALTDGEITHLSNLHKAHFTGNSFLGKHTLTGPIVGAAFLPGFKTRAVTAGGDGRCRIIDFSSGGIIVRTWHAKAPLTSITVLAKKLSTCRLTQNPTAVRRHIQKPDAHLIGGPTTTDSLIAVARVDGQVHIYDALGLLLQHMTVSSHEEKIIGIEWVKGTSPSAIDKHGVSKQFTDALSPFTLEYAAMHSDSSLEEASSNETTIISPRCTRKAFPESAISPHILVETSSQKRSTILPSEEDQQIIRQIPEICRQQPNPKAVLRGDYHDLFSPLKPPDTALAVYSKTPGKTPARNRLRLSNHTFLDHDQGIAFTGQRGSETHTMNAQQEYPSGSAVRPKNTRSRTTTVPARRVSTQKTPTKLRSRTQDPTPNTNARVLAELRKLSYDHPTRRNLGTLSAYATLHHRQHLRSATVCDNLRGQAHPFAHEPTTKERVIHENAPETWPTDSVDASSLEEFEDDIWLTSNSDVADDRPWRQKVTRSLHAPQKILPPRTRRPAPVSINIGSPTQQAVATRPSRPETQRSNRFHSTTEDETFTARSYFSPDGTVEPASERVRELFPRSSSMSPPIKRHPSLSHQAKRTRNQTVLADIPLNLALGRRPAHPKQIPRSYMVADDQIVLHSDDTSTHKNASATPQAQKYINTTAVRPPHPLELADAAAETALARRYEITRDISHGNAGHSMIPNSQTSQQQHPMNDNKEESLAAARIQTLEAEVTLLKAEVLALKAVLRNNGFPLPKCLRR